MDNMDRLLQAAADEANAYIPYAHMKNEILERARARRERQNRILRYSSMAAAFVVLLCAGAYFIGGSGIGRAKDIVPQSVLFDDGSAKPEACDRMAGGMMPEAMPAPMAPPGDNGTEAEPVAENPDAEPAGINGIKPTSDDYGGVLLTEYVGEPTNGFTADSFLVQLEDIIKEEICSDGVCLTGAEITVEVVDARYESLDVGYASIAMPYGSDYAATWRTAQDNYTVIIFPCKYSPEQIMSFLRAMAGNQIIE